MKLEHNSFKCEILQRIFTVNGGVDLPNPTPVFYYPFGCYDSDSHILSNIIPVLLQFRGKEFNVEDILKVTHNKLFDYMDQSFIDSLKGRVGNLLRSFSENPSLHQFFDLPTPKNKFKLKEFGIKRFQTATTAYLSKADKEAPSQKQTTLKKFPLN